MAKKKRMFAKERKQQQINLRIKKATEESTKKVNTTVAVNNKPISKEIRKSKAKLAGVKWVIKANDDVAYISSFGKR